MTRLTPCPSCRRHVRAGAEPCPFCGSREEREAPRPLPPAGLRLTRAAVFAGALAACGSTTGKQQQGAEPVDAGLVSNAQDLDANTTPDARLAPVKPPDNHCCKPYGAPPARIRLV
jgi:hypothetical protein